ncbi:acyltransferase [Coxiella endosymbiont of Amblyomma sculptum]|nr:acyltransferase [Coxiella endosymbiont of Amblyomma sculptum]
MRRLFNFLLGVLLVFLYTILSFALGTFALIFGFLSRVVLVKSWYRRLMKIALFFPVLWSVISGKFLELRNLRWKTIGECRLSSRQWYLLISNHQTWLDILVLGRVFGCKVPVIKFFMKRELLWKLPILGLSCWFLEYPFLYRYSHRKIRNQPKLRKYDVEAVKKACKKFEEFPTTVVNFVEGTRFKVVKKSPFSPYVHLLNPKAGGIAVVIKELNRKLSGILNVTIHYSHNVHQTTDSRTVTFWKYFCGEFSAITVYYELLPITTSLVGDYYTNRDFRRSFQQWLNSIWKRKDLLLDKLDRHPVSPYKSTE